MAVLQGPRRCVGSALLFLLGLLVGWLSCDLHGAGLSLDYAPRWTPSSSLAASLAAEPAAPIELGVLSSARVTTCDSHVVERGLKPMAVIATTMRDAGEGEIRRKIQRNTIRGFMAQTPVDAVHPLVFTDSDSLAAEVREETIKVQGDGLETVAPIPEVRHGFPTIRGIMKEALAAARRAGASYYGYANGDILFTEDLVATLRLVSEASRADFFPPSSSLLGAQPGVMIIGRRTNFNFADYVDHIDHQSPCKLSELFLNMAKDGKPMVPHAIDYFIFSTEARVDWGALEDWIIGNLAFDQYLVKYAGLAKLHIIDATDTIHAFHQTGSDGNSAGHARPKETSAHNGQLWEELGPGGCKVRNNNKSAAE
jgi:hypothetical protein